MGIGDVNPCLTELARLGWVLMLTGLPNTGINPADQRSSLSETFSVSFLPCLSFFWGVFFFFFSIHAPACPSNLGSVACMRIRTYIRSTKVLDRY